jgi:hypothetical protein
MIEFQSNSFSDWLDTVGMIQMKIKDTVSSLHFEFHILLRHSSPDASRLKLAG